MLCVRNILIILLFILTWYYFIFLFFIFDTVHLRYKNYFSLENLSSISKHEILWKYIINYMRFIYNFNGLKSVRMEKQGICFSKGNKNWNISVTNFPISINCKRSHRFKSRGRSNTALFSTIATFYSHEWFTIQFNQPMFVPLESSTLRSIYLYRILTFYLYSALLPYNILDFTVPFTAQHVQLNRRLKSLRDVISRI